MKKYLLFDLDGTLINTYEGIVKCVYYALNSLEIEESEPEKLKRFIGPPLEYSFKNYYNLNDTGVRKAIEKYRERYSEKGIYECKPYDGMKELLSKCYEDKRIICLATAKPQPFAEKILEMFDLKKYFSVIVGASLDNSFVEKSDIVAKVLSDLGDVPKSEMIMIGDREHDIIGAKNNGIESIGIKYGFAEIGEFEEAGANYIVENVEELVKLLKV